MSESSETVFVDLDTYLKKNLNVYIEEYPDAKLEDVVSDMKETYLHVKKNYPMIKDEEHAKKIGKIMTDITCIKISERLIEKKNVENFKKDGCDEEAIENYLRIKKAERAIRKRYLNKWPGLDFNDLTKNIRDGMMEAYKKQGETDKPFSDYASEVLYNKINKSIMVEILKKYVKKILDFYPFIESEKFYEDMFKIMDEAMEKYPIKYNENENEKIDKISDYFNKKLQKKISNEIAMFGREIIMKEPEGSKY